MISRVSDLNYECFKALIDNGVAKSLIFSHNSGPLSIGLGPQLLCLRGLACS